QGRTLWPTRLARSWPGRRRTECGASAAEVPPRAAPVEDSTGSAIACKTSLHLARGNRLELYPVRPSVAASRHLPGCLCRFPLSREDVRSLAGASVIVPGEADFRGI